MSPSLNTKCCMLHTFLSKKLFPFNVMIFTETSDESSSSEESNEHDNSDETYSSAPTTYTPPKQGE